MDSAVAELLSADHNSKGVLIWFFEILRHPINDEKRLMCKYRESLPFIPPTVLFNYSRAQGWYESYLLLADQRNIRDHGNAANLVPPRDQHEHSKVSGDRIPSTLSPASASAKAMGESSGGGLLSTGDATSPAVHRSQSGIVTENCRQSPEQRQFPRRQYFVEYRKRKVSDLTTNTIAASFCPSYSVISDRIAAKEAIGGRGATSATSKDTSGGKSRVRVGNCGSLFSVAAVAQQLPRGRLCAQTIRKSVVDEYNISERRAPLDTDAVLYSKNEQRQHVQSSSAAEASVQFFDEFELGQLLFHNTVDYALLQRFTHPSESFSHGPVHNSVLIAEWQPHYCFVVRAEALASLGTAHQASQLRGDTFDHRLSKYRGPAGWNVHKAICNACNALAERVYFATDGIRIRKMSLVFKLDARKDRVILQWCQSACVAKGPSVLTIRDELLANLPVSGTKGQSDDHSNEEILLRPREDDEVIRRQGGASSKSADVPMKGYTPVPHNFVYGRGESNEGREREPSPPYNRAVGEHVAKSGMAIGAQDGHQKGVTDGPEAGELSTVNGNGVRFLLGRSGGKAAEIRRRIDKSFGPLRPRGLLTRTKLDYMLHRLEGASKRNGPPRGLPQGPNASEASGCGHSRAMYDIIRDGREEEEKDVLFESLAPRGWASRRRRKASAHDLLSELRSKTKTDDATIVSGLTRALTPSQNGAVSCPRHLLMSREGVQSAANTDVYTPFVPFSEPSREVTSGANGESNNSVLTRGHADATSDVNVGSRRAESERHDPPSSLRRRRRIVNLEESEVVDPNTWGVTSRVDQVLLLPLGTEGPYGLSRMAVDAGRLGYREAYLRTTERRPKTAM